MKEAAKVTIQVIGWKPYPATEELEALCREIVAEKSFPAVVERITDIGKLSELQIAVPPGLVINGKVVSSKIVPEKFTIVQWISEALEALDDIHLKPNQSKKSGG